MQTRIRTHTGSRWSLLALLTLLFVPAGLAGQMEDSQVPGVAFVNESTHEVRVYAFHQDEEEREFIGWVGGDEVEFLAIPDEAMGPDGTFHIAVQRILPLPQLGVPATPHPLHPTTPLRPEPGETVRVVLQEDMGLVFEMIP